MSIPPAPSAKRSGGADPRRRPDGSGSAADLGFAPSPEESVFFGEMFRRADVEGTGIVAAGIALQLLPKSNLPQETLRAIWSIADAEQKGFLTMGGFYKALKLVAVAQAGQPVAPGLLGMKTPLPAFEGIPTDIGITNAPPSVPSTPSPLSRSGTGFGSTPSGGMPSSDSPAYKVSPEERQRWINAFQQAGPTNGAVGAVAARDFFLRSGLAPDTLSKIWTVADSQGRGMLGVNDFMVAMYLISRVKSGAFPSVPGSLPASLLATISGQPTPGPVPTPAAPSFEAPPSPVKLPSVATDMGPEWAIGGKEKEAYDRVFDKTDVGGKGYLSTEEASGFFRQSNLPSNALANIWSLSNISKSGRYSREEFAVAMHLIRRARAGIPLPPSLPADLVPPSLRRPSLSAPAPAPAPPPPAPQADLFSFDSLPPVTPAPVPAVPPTPLPSAPSALFSPALGSTVPATPRTVTTSLTTSTIFPDTSLPSRSPALMATDIATTPPVPKPTSQEDNLRTEIANRKQEISMAQVSSATMQISADQTRQRLADLEAELARLTAEKEQVTGQVNQIRALYDADRMVVQQLEGTAAPLRAEVAALQNELAQTTTGRDALRTQVDTLNGEIIQLREQVAQLKEEAARHGGELQSDGEEVARLSAEADGIKAEIEQTRLAIQAALSEKQARAADLENKKAEIAAMRAEQVRLRAEKEAADREAAALAAQTAAIAAAAVEPEPVAVAAVETVPAATIPPPIIVPTTEAAPTQPVEETKAAALAVDVNDLEDPFAEPSEPSPPIPDSSTKPKARVTPEPPSTEAVKAPEVPVEAPAAAVAVPEPGPPAEAHQVAEAPAPEQPTTAHVEEVQEAPEAPPRTPSPFDVGGFENRFPDIDAELAAVEQTTPSTAASASAEAAPAPVAIPEPSPATPETRPSAAVETIAAEPTVAAAPMELTPVSPEPVAVPEPAPEPVEVKPPSPVPVPAEPVPEASPAAATVSAESNPFESDDFATTPAATVLGSTKTPFDMPDLDAEFDDAFKDIPAANTAAAAAAFDDSVFDATLEDDSFKFESQAKFATTAPPPVTPGAAPSVAAAPVLKPGEVTPVSGLSNNFVNFESAFDAPFDGGFGGAPAHAEEDPFLALHKGGSSAVTTPLPKTEPSDIDAAFGPSTFPAASGSEDDNPFAAGSVAAASSSAAAPADFGAFEADFASAFDGALPAASFEETVAAPAAAPALAPSSSADVKAPLPPGPRPPSADEAEEIKLVKEMTSCTTDVAMDALNKTDWNVERAINHILG